MQTCWRQGVARAIDIARRVKGQIETDRLSIIAAGVAFYGLLAVFPGLVALVGLYGLVFDPAQVDRHVAALSAMLPPEAAEVLLGQLQDLATTDRAALRSAVCCLRSGARRRGCAR